jgi:formylglycine-generating enzyme required for sulfatase activity
LPSEAQWEKAARGSNGNLFPWGNDWQEDRCNTTPKTITPVDAFPAQNDYGCFDMVGNTREWTCSLWGANRREPDLPYRYPWKGDRHNDLNANLLIRRVYRGGIAKTPMRLSCTCRSGFAPDKTGPQDDRHGFRVVLAV